MPKLDFESSLHLMDDGDEEMGIFPLIAAAIPAATSLVGSLISKGGKKGGDPKAAIDAQSVLSALRAAQASGEDSKNMASIVKNIVKTIPSPVQKNVKQALKELADAKAAGTLRTKGIVTAVDHAFGPQIAAMLAAIKVQRKQAQATHEHNRIKSRDQFRSDTRTGLQAIASRLDRIEAGLRGVAVVRGSQRIALLGGRTVLEK